MIQKVAGLVLEDITERKKAEKTLRQSEQSLNSAQEAADIGSWDWNLAENTLIWSDKTYKQFGLKPGEITSTYEAFSNFVHPDDLDSVNQAVKDALDGGKDYSIDFE